MKSIMSRKAGSRFAGKNLTKLVFPLVFSTVLLGAAVPALAAAPFLSVTPQGNGNVQLTVSNADPFAQITLYRRQSTQLWTVVTNFGQTSQSGFYSTLTSLAGDGSNNVVEHYVVVNGQQSSVVQTFPSGYGGCSYYSCGGSLSLSQANVSVNAGQNMSVYATNGSNNALYVASNSNSSVATVTASGNTVNVYGITSGSTTASICSNNTGCVYLYISVSGNGCQYNNCYASLTFSPSSLNMQLGQTTVVRAQNTSGNAMYISNNSNSSIVSVSVSGTDLNVTSNNPGSTTVTVCTSFGQCNSFMVTVTGNNYGSLSFSQNNVYLNSNQSQSVSVYGNNNNYNNYYISSNSNSSVVSANISGNTLFLYAQGTWGTSNIMVCQNSNSCGTVMVTVNGFQNTNCTYNCGNITLNTASLPAMYIGQYYSYQLQASGGSAPYTYSVQSGYLPSGLTLGSNGNIYGTPQNTQNNSFTLRVTDTFGRSTTVNVSIGGGSVLGAATYSNGQVVNEGGTVYIVYKNMKTAFGNAAAFTGLGYSWGQVTNVGYSGLTNTGYVISTAKAAHPWGAWVKSGSTVYFVHELGLIPVADYATFLNNGGQDYQVVQANFYDFQRPMLSVMTTNDARLR